MVAIPLPPPSHPPDHRPIVATRSPSAAIRAVLADHAWHAFAEISARASPLIRPETALRDHRSANPGSRYPLWAQVESGRQRFVLRALGRMGVESEGGRRVVDRRYRLPVRPAPVHARIVSVVHNPRSKTGSGAGGTTTTRRPGRRTGARSGRNGARRDTLDIRTTHDRRQ